MMKFLSRLNVCNDYQGSMGAWTRQRTSSMIRLSCLLLFLVFNSLSFAEEPFREWTNLDGRKIKARFIEGTKGQVKVRRTDGRTFKIPLDNLSEEDRKYVKSLIFDPTDGLVAWYPFNGNAQDESGNGHHGKVIGATLCKDRKGNEDSAYLFAMTGESINLGNSPKLNPKNEMTISAWIKLGKENDFFKEQGKYGLPIVTRYCGGVGKFKSYILRINHNRTLGAYVYHKVISRESATASSPYDLGRTIDYESSHFVALTFNSSEGGYTFLDGDILNHISPKHSSESLILQSSANTMIGSFSNSNFMEFNGVIDDVRIYEKALSANQIKSLYELEK
ncbi:MAG: hypothetical protein CMI20_08050 [Opitutae bacterium]|nr:hypothetical protein [Opitutae bacterium]